MTDHLSPRAPARVLALNAGSSSIKFALYDATAHLSHGERGKIERIGHADAKLTVEGEAATQVAAENRATAARTLLDWLESRELLTSISVVGHRVVHGGTRYGAPARIDDELIHELRRISEYSPEHLPAEIDLIEAFRARLPEARHVACFDTAFHRDMPRVAQILPIPRRLAAKGIRRFGFHGLSYAYLMRELVRVAGADAAAGRVILAHLGNGSSLAAVLHRHSIDTTMAFTPAAGVPMSTRTGDLDPGLLWYLSRSENMSAEQLHRMVNQESGLLGVSETSSDMRELLALEASDERAAEAVALYCYQVAKSIGAFAVALGGLDMIVFSGGIGENAPVIRQRIGARLGVLGVILDERRNGANDGILSADTSRVTVRMIRTDEECLIARLSLEHAT